MEYGTISPLYDEIVPLRDSSYILHLSTYILLELGRLFPPPFPELSAKFLEALAIVLGLPYTPAHWELTANNILVDEDNGVVTGFTGWSRVRRQVMGWTLHQIDFAACFLSPEGGFARSPELDATWTGFWDDLAELGVPRDEIRAIKMAKMVGAVFHLVLCILSGPPEFRLGWYRSLWCSFVYEDTRYMEMDVIDEIEV